MGCDNDDDVDGDVGSACVCCRDDGEDGDDDSVDDDDGDGDDDEGGDDDDADDGKSYDVALS